MKFDTKQFGGSVVGTKEIVRDGVNIGIISGYIATWDLDRGDWRYKDQFVKGCFAESIAEFKKLKRMPRFKDGHGRTIGGWRYESLKEDDKGLFGEAEVNLDVQQGAEVYSLAKQKVLTDFSIGFEVQEKIVDEEKRIRTITKAIIWEGSIVDEPMNPKANVTDIKNLDIDLPSDEKGLFSLAAGIIGVFGKYAGEGKEAIADHINEHFKGLGRKAPVDNDVLIVDKQTVKELTQRELESILSSNKACFTRQAGTTLISYLNFEGMRDAAGKSKRDAEPDNAKANETCDKIIKLLEA